MRLSDINKWVAERSGQGTPHNLGIGERRFGNPRTDVERRRKHKARFGTTKLPPRGTGLGSGQGVPHNPGIRPKEVTRALRHPDKPGAGARARKGLRGQKKVHAVMAEFKRGTLRSGSGAKVTNRKQAQAIAMSEAGLSRKKKS